MTTGARPQRPFHTLLVANRGEIALRVMRSARRMGLCTVAIYSDADRMGPHVAMADRAVRVGAAAPRDSYLNIAAILDAAHRAGADAIHPGYGFLAENDDFAAAVQAAGLVFVGPPAEAIRAMGNKAAAKRLMLEAGMPCIPGYQGADQRDAALLQAATEIGWPMMVKAAAGGGGRGMRLVPHAGELAAALASARSEALSAFGSDELILERALVDARHIEIQLLADAHGHAISLGERDCSVQRRHQKLIEEAPSPAVTPDVRRRMGEAAVRAALAIGYVGAGTMEFLLEHDGSRFHFMEMNTRLQVEHAVTEAVTGLDLVEWQLRIAAGEPLTLAQDAVRQDGHAIEVRLTAEDVPAGFLPQTGPVLRWRPPDAARDVRVDHSLVEGGSVSPHYDSMIAKLVAHGRTRDEARLKLLRALEDCVLLGVTTNQGFLADCLAHDAWVRGDVDTGFIARHFGDALRLPAMPRTATTALAALLAAGLEGRGDRHVLGSRLAVASVDLGIGKQRVVTARIAARPEGGWDVSLHETGTPPPAVERVVVRDLQDIGNGELRAECDGISERAVVARDARTLHLFHQQRAWRYALVDPRKAKAAPVEDGTLVAPLTGKVVAVPAAVGDRVHAGQVLVVIEAMKMEHALAAPFDGTLAELHVQVGTQVASGGLLLRVVRDVASANAIS